MHKPPSQTQQEEELKKTVSALETGKNSNSEKNQLRTEEEEEALKALVADSLLMISEIPINIEIHHQDDSGVTSSISSSNSPTNENSTSTNSTNLDSNPKNSACWNIISKKRLKLLEEKSTACDRMCTKISTEKFTWDKPISRRTLAVALSFAPSVSYIAFTRIMSCVLAGFFGEASIKYDAKELTKSLPCESTLSNILQETSIETLVTVRKKCAESKIFFCM